MILNIKPDKVEIVLEAIVDTRDGQISWVSIMLQEYQ
jgi:hypothetical protein